MCGTFRVYLKSFMTWTNSMKALLMSFVFILGCSKSKPELSTLNSSLLSSSVNSLSINLNKSSSAPAATNDLNLIEYTIVFSEPINTTSFTQADVSLDTGSTITNVTTWSITLVSGDYKTFTLKPTTVTGEGYIIPKIDPAGILSSSGKPFQQIYSTQKTVKFDLTAPTFTITRNSTQSATSSGFPIRFSLHFNEAINPLTTSFTGGVSNLGTLAGVVWVVTNTGNDIDFDVEATSATGSTGTVYPGIAASVVSDLAGLANAAGSASTSEAVTYTAAASAPSAPASLTLYSPGSSPGSTSAPTITVTGLTIGDDLRLFRDPTCSTAVSGFVSVTAASQNVTISLPSVDATYNIYARASNSAGTSPCSTATVAYQLILAVANLTISDGSIYVYGSVAVGADVDKTFTLTNSGAAQATSISAATLSSGFSFKGGSFPGTSGTCSGSLSAGSSCTFVVSFTPTSGGATNYTTTISINYNDGSTSTSATRGVQGTGYTSASLSISDASLYDFGTVSVGTNQDHTFTLTNSGESTANSIVGAGISAPYSFLGGSFPGTGGTCAGSLSAGGSCTFVVRFSPTSSGVFNATIAINHSNGVSNTSANRDITGTGGTPPLVVAPVYSGFSNWNDYVKNSGAACAGTETGYYGDTVAGCAHAGLARKVVVTGQASCTNLTIVDSVGAFNWNCDETSGTATFSIIDFKPGKGLRDLILPTPAWKSMSVDVLLSGTSIASSTPTAWWGDTFTPISGNTSSAILNVTGPTIFYINTNTTIESLRATSSSGNTGLFPFSIVSLNSSQLSFFGGATTNLNSSFCSTSTPQLNVMLCFYNLSRVWIEADFNGTGTNKADSAIYLQNMKFTRIHNTSISNMKNTSSSGINYKPISIYGVGSIGNLITNVKIYKATGGIFLGNTTSAVGNGKNIIKGLHIAGVQNSHSIGATAVHMKASSNNQVDDVSVASVTAGGGPAYGVLLETNSSENILKHLQISNIQGISSSEGMAFLTASSANIVSQATLTATGDAGVYLGASSYNIFSHITAANNSYNGYFFAPGVSDANTFNSIVSINTAAGNGGIETDLAASGSGNKFFNIASVENGAPVKVVDPSFTATTVNGYLIIKSGTACTFPGSTGTHINLSASCSSTNGGFTMYGVTGTSLQSAFGGWTSTDDASNPLLGSYAISYSALNSLDNWLNFESPFRAWGNYFSSPFPYTSHKGACTSGSCAIFDWRVKSGGPFHNRSFDGTTANSASFSGFCTGYLDGSPATAITTTFPAPIITFLKYAVEAPWKSSGNNGNGLCEANEECIYAPNIGAYQGEGDPLASGNYCNTSSGAAVPNVKIYAYPITSVP